MGWGDTLGYFSDLYGNSDGSSFGTDSSIDWGSMLGDSGGSNNDVWGLDWSGGGSGGNWYDSFTGGGGGGGSDSTSSWMSKLGSMFGGSGSGGSGSGNIFGALLSGLSGAAGSWMDSKNAEKAVKMKGEQDRKTIAFTGDLQDYYKQKDKVRKRIGLDTYGQFSQLKRWAPNYVDTPMPDQPAKPTPQGY